MHHCRSWRRGAVRQTSELEQLIPLGKPMTARLVAIQQHVMIVEALFFALSLPSLFSNGLPHYFSTTLTVFSGRKAAPIIPPIKVLLETYSIIIRVYIHQVCRHACGNRSHTSFWRGHEDNRRGPPSQEVGSHADPRPSRMFKAQNRSGVSLNTHGSFRNQPSDAEGATGYDFSMHWFILTHYPLVVVSNSSVRSLLQHGLAFNAQRDV
ncbi:hypothetical protein LIA77_08504 [Sarocladium implicatum]|nr:hypothetical protein LIA77_08504 [Sarocladium implicatum]